MEDARRFGEMYDRWWLVVWEAAGRCVASDDDADDAAQSVFTRLWDNGGWRSISSPRSYFRAAGRNAARKLATHSPREVTASTVDSERILRTHADPHTVWMRRLRWKLLLRLLQGFPPVCAAVMVRIYILGMPRRQAAEELDMTLKAVEKQITRGRRLLRKKIRTPLGREWLSTFGDGGG